MAERDPLVVVVEDDTSVREALVRLLDAGGFAATGHATAEEFRQRLSIRSPSVQVEVEKLSGGNQQKVVVARELDRNPRFMLVNQPTHVCKKCGRAGNSKKLLCRKRCESTTNRSSSSKARATN